MYSITAINAAARAAPLEARLMVSSLVVWDCGVGITGAKEEEGVVGVIQVLLMSVVKVVAGEVVGAGDSICEGRGTTFVDSGCVFTTGGVFGTAALGVSWGAICRAPCEGCRVFGVSLGIRGASSGGFGSSSGIGSFGASGVGVVSILPVAGTVEEIVMVTGGISPLGGVQ